MDTIVLMCDSFICRLCGDENPNSIPLFGDESQQQPDLSQLVNKYLPLKIENNCKLPNRICPGCNIQLEATKLFMDLIVKGQEKLTKLCQLQEEQLGMNVLNPNCTINTYTIQSDGNGENFLIQVVSGDSLYGQDHELALNCKVLDKPKKKRGRPSKQSVKVKEEETKYVEEEDEEESFAKTVEDKDSDLSRGRRKIKVPLRYMEAIQGKELEKVFIQEGVIDEDVGNDKNFGLEMKKKENVGEEIIGRIEDENGINSGKSVIYKHKFRNNIANKENKKKLIKTTIIVKEQSNESDDTKKDDVGEEDNEEQNNKDPLTSDEKEKCYQCEKSFACKQNYETHMRAVHNGEKPFVCTHCQKPFAYLNNLRVHLLRHKRNTNQEAVFPCTICQKTFRHPSSLQYHRETKHATGRRFVCNKCDKSFNHRQLLQRHQLVHSDDRPYECQQCAAAFKTRANLINHTAAIHKRQRRFNCDQCSATFAHKTSLVIHERWHSGTRPYKCDICEKRFSQKGNLAEHRRIHTGEKPYRCDECDRSFTTSSQFRMHRKRHTGERPHHCNYCSKSFLHIETLKSHVRRHLDLKPFVCGHCGKAFTEQWALKKHERLHTGEKPYGCDVCGKVFADSSNLVKHRRTHDKKVVYVTSYQTEKTEPEEKDTSPPLQLQQLVDQHGNPISLTTLDGQQVRVVTSIEEGQENIRGLLADGTLIPIDLTFQDKNKEMEDNQEVKFNSLSTVDNQILDANTIEFLPDQKIDNIDFITEDNANMCLVTSYNVVDNITQQYATIT